MKISVWLYAGLLLASLCGAEPVDPRRPPAITVSGVPVVPAELAERLRQYQSVRWARFRGWAPDGKGMLIQTQFGNTAQLHRVYEPGGRREQITFQEEPTDGRFLPHHSEGVLLLEFSRGGDENTQLQRLKLSDGRPVLWTDGKSRNLLGPVLADGSRAIVSSNRRHPRDQDLYIVRLDEPSAWEELLRVDNQLWTATDWSRDGGKVLVQHYVSINESSAAVLDVASRRLQPIPPPPGHGAKVAVSQMKFAPDGRAVYLATDARGEFRELARFDLERREYTWLSPEWTWDVDEIEVDGHTGRVAVTFNEDGSSALCLLEHDRLRRVDLPVGVVSGMEFSPDGSRLGFTFSPAYGPSEAYALDWATHALTRWTYSEVGGLNPASFVTPRRIQFRSFDGLTIPAWYYPTRKPSPAGKSPVLIQIHGGPESQYRPTFSGIDQFWLNEMGIAVIWPNVRGSQGYGKTYLQLDNAEKREDAVRDIGALLDWIREQPELDAERVAVMGASYGGYMTLAAAVHYSSRLKAAVDIVGIANFITFLETTSEYRRDLRRAEYGDERDPAMRAVFERLNPSHNAHKIRTALMVIHGRNDPRVPFSEAEQIAPLVRQNGVEVWTLYADNEGHGFRKRDNRDYMTAAIALFLERQLLK
jgi:dipeptidyl aminopeptidase/acylaminoacyl peptidase